VLDISELKGKNRPEPIKELVIDCHAHIGNWHNFYIPWPDVESMIEVMDRLGFDMVCMTAHAAIGPDFKRGNDEVIDVLKKYPDRFRGYVTVNPPYEDELIKELERCFSRDGFFGIKLHPESHDYSVDEGFCVPVFEYAQDKELPILSHTWNSAQILKKLARNYPDIKFLMAHASQHCAVGGEDYLETAREENNVFLDIASSTVSYGMIERLVDKAGEDKILFGTDFPFIEASVQLGSVLGAEITDLQKEKILGKNMKRIIES